MLRRIVHATFGRVLPASLPFCFLLLALAFVYSQNRTSLSLKGHFSIAGDAEMREKFPTRIASTDVERADDHPSIPEQIPTRTVARKFLLERRAGLRISDRGHNVSFTTEIPEFIDDVPFLKTLNRQLRHEYGEAATEFATAEWSTVVEGLHSPSFPMLGWEGSISIDILHCSACAVSLLEFRSEYTGGAHGNCHLVGRNFMVLADQVHELVLDELFDKESLWKKRLLKYCASDLRCQGASSIGDCSVESPEEFDFTTDDLASFTMSPSGMSFYFSPYHVGCYAEGIYVVRMPWSEIKDCIAAESPARLFMAMDLH